MGEREDRFEQQDSALIVPVPEAEPAVGRWRERFDPSASLGVPAHVTVLFPFISGDDVDDATLDEIERLMSRISPFTAEFRDVERHDGMVWIRPVPEAPFRALTAAVWDRWPDHPPYQGRFDDVIPHLTIAEEASGPVPPDAVEDVSRHLPITTSVDTVELIAFVDGQWITLADFRLGG